LGAKWSRGIRGFAFTIDGNLDLALLQFVENLHMLY